MIWLLKVLVAINIIVILLIPSSEILRARLSHLLVADRISLSQLRLRTQLRIGSSLQPQAHLWVVLCVLRIIWILTWASTVGYLSNIGL